MLRMADTPRKESILCRHECRRRPAVLTGRRRPGSLPGTTETDPPRRDKGVRRMPAEAAARRREPERESPVGKGASAPGYLHMKRPHEEAP